jgi:hypothetical protein
VVRQARCRDGPWRRISRNREEKMWQWTSADLHVGIFNPHGNRSNMGALRT